MRRLAGALLLAAGVMAGCPALSQPPPDRKGAAPPKSSPAAPAQPPSAAPGATVPPPEVLLVLLRTSLLALDHANKVNDYGVLRALGAPELQKFSPDQLSQLFAGLRSANIDLSPVAVITPQVLEPPAITPEGLLRLVGFFPTQPLQIQFEIVFQPINGQWRLFGLTVRAAAPRG